MAGFDCNNEMMLHVYCEYLLAVLPLYLILNPVIVISSDVNGLLNLRNVKLIKWNNITRLCINLMDSTNMSEIADRILPDQGKLTQLESWTPEFHQYFWPELH